MLIKFSITNFLSFNDKQCFSMEAGKARKNSKRIYRNKNIKLTKCEVIFGANASGKSNLVEAFQFVQDMVVDGLPRGFTNKYFRQIPANQSIPSSFKIELLLDNKHIVYEFSVLLKNGSIEEEHLYELTTSNQEKSIFYRNLKSSTFEAGDYIRNKNDKINSSYTQQTNQEKSINKTRNVGTQKVPMSETEQMLKRMNEYLEEQKRKMSN